MSKVEKTSPRKIIIAIVVVAVILAVLLIPMVPIQEAYSVTEPYERKATYIVDDANLQEKIGFLNVYVQSDITVRNTDEYGGTFKVIHKLYDIDGLFGTVTDSFYLGEGQSHTSTATFDTKWGQDTKGKYSVTAPTVIDEKMVTEHRTVYKSIIELIIYS